MKVSWSVRQVRPEDADEVAAHGCFRSDDAQRRPLYSAWVRSRIASGRYVGRFAVLEGVVVGGAGAILLDWGPTRANPRGEMARIVNVFVAEAQRGQGIARMLLAEVMAQCEASGVLEFNLGTTPEARSLYGSLGFVDYPAEMRRRSSVVLAGSRSQCDRGR